MKKEKIAQVLSEKHRKTLEVDSSISSADIAARGYRTVTNKTELRNLGFPLTQSMVPSLLIPIWGVSGNVVLYQSRPDNPRMLKGRMVKYETPKNSRMVLDIHPRMREKLADPKIPLWITEGIKKGDSLVSRNCCAIALLGVWNWRGTNEYGGKTALADWEYIALNNRRVYICFDSDVMLKKGVHSALIRIKEFLESRGANVSLIYLPPGIGGTKQGVDDYFAPGKTVEELMSLATSELKPIQNSLADSIVEASSTADRAVAYVLGSGVELFHDELGEPFIVFETNQERRQIWPLKSKAGTSYIRWRFLHTEGKGLNNEALTTAKGTLVSKAEFDGQERPLSVRVAKTNDGYWYDLGDWRAVQITKLGWCVINKPPIIFRHFSHQAVQSDPVHGGDLEGFLDLINITDNNMKLLTKVYLVASLIAGIPVPTLAVCGEHGSAKSTLLKMLRALIDPSKLQSLSIPDSLKEFVQIAAHHRTVYFDNLSYLSDWLSDALCRLCTGDGFSKRGLYTDDEDVIYSVRGLGGVNGINLVATKSDLLDRSIVLRLDPIPSEKRRTEEEVWRRFASIRGSTLGAMFDLMSSAIQHYENSQSDYALSRMADFSKWGIVISEALGYSAKDFLDAYGSNVQVQNESAIEENPVAQAIMAFSHTNEEWEGTASALLTELENLSEGPRVDVRSKEWPKAAHILARRLREIVPNLRRAGVAISDRRTDGTRIWHLTRKAPENSALTDTSATPEAKSNIDGIKVALLDPSVAPLQSPVAPLEKSPNDPESDASSGSSGIFPPTNGQQCINKKVAKDNGEV